MQISNYTDLYKTICIVLLLSFQHAAIHHIAHPYHLCICLIFCHLRYLLLHFCFKIESALPSRLPALLSFMFIFAPIVLYSCHLYPPHFTARKCFFLFYFLATAYSILCGWICCSKLAMTFLVLSSFNHSLSIIIRAQFCTWMQEQRALGKVSTVSNTFTNGYGCFFAVL